MSEIPHKLVDERVSCDPGNVEFYSNPYPTYSLMREIGSFFYWEEYGIWCAAGHEKVSSILRDRRFGRQMEGVDLAAWAPTHLKNFYRFESNSLLELEPPAHTRLRRLVNRAFISRKIESLRPEIFALANRLIDGFIAKGETELLRSYAEIIPVQIIANILGVPVSHCDQLLSWSHAMVAMYQHNRSRDIEDKAEVATREFCEYLFEIVARRRNRREDNLISHLVNQQDEGDAISDDELVTTCILLLNAGHEATVHAIGNGVKALLQQKVQPVSEIFAAYDIADICEELLRFDPPLHKFTRFVREDLRIGGRNFKRGDTIGLLLGAANRDPVAFSNPDGLDFQRLGLAGANTAFGAGIHFCIGAPLARMELQIALPVLFARLPQLSLVTMPKYADRYHFHGLEALQVGW